jgi:hypothetical protein
MKQKLISLSTVMAFVLLFVTGCQKEIQQKEETSLAENSLQGTANQNNGKCQLTHFNVEGFDNRFHYNNKGLADEWRIDFGDGIPDVFTMKYDDNDQLSQAWYHYDGQLIASIEFEWNRKLITEEHWDYQGYLFDVVNIYDHKGQMIKREFSDGYSVATTFSPNGNTPRVDLFYDGELFLKLDFTYNKPNKNPFLAIRGIPYGFPFVAFTFSNWWETSEKQTVYENGIPSVVLDMDPAQTVMQLGFQNYPSLITAYDRIGSSSYHYSFEFQNCGPKSNYIEDNVHSKTQGLKSVKRNPNANLKYLLQGPSEQIKQQLKALRKQNK